MPLIEYKTFNFRKASIAVINLANKIIAEYREQGYELTLRQLYYQFIVRGIIPNSDKEYKKLGSVINDGRLAGLIDWDAIEDRTRPSRGNSHWVNPQERMLSAAEYFRIDSRADQDFYVEVWIEKDALLGILEQACIELDVPYLSCRGYVSQSSMWEAAQRFISHEENGKESRLIHLGDHDPSGIDMSRDIQERLRLFRSGCQVERIALTREQIDKYNPPPNPAKLTDSRCNGYIAEYGDKSWELDALEPQVITALIQNTVECFTDIKRRNRLLKLQNRHRNDMRWIAKYWNELLKVKNKKSK